MNDPIGRRGSLMPDRARMETHWVLQVDGEMDLSNAGSLLHEVRASSIDGDLTLDLSGLTFIDVAGAREILALCAEAQRNGHRISVASPTRPVRRVLNLILTYVDIDLRIT
jgi:anti-anti-sigma factor